MHELISGYIATLEGVLAKEQVNASVRDKVTRLIWKMEADRDAE